MTCIYRADFNVRFRFVNESKIMISGRRETVTDITDIFDGKLFAANMTLLNMIPGSLNSNARRNSAIVFSLTRHF